MENFEKITKKLLDGEKPSTVHEMLYKLGEKLRDDPKVMRSMELALADCNAPAEESATLKWLMYKICVVEWYFLRPMPSPTDMHERAKGYLTRMPWIDRKQEEVSDEEKEKADLESKVFKLVLEGDGKTAKELAETICVATDNPFPYVYSLVLKARRNLKQSTKEVVKEVRKRGRKGSRKR